MTPAPFDPQTLSDILPHLLAGVGATIVAALALAGLGMIAATLRSPRP